MVKVETENVERLHVLFDCGLPGSGTWTTYGDLNEAIGNNRGESNWIGSHFGRRTNPCEICHPFTHRVLEQGGVFPDVGKRSYTIPDKGTHEKRLAAEGVMVVGGVVIDEDAFIGAEDLAAALEGFDEHGHVNRRVKSEITRIVRDTATSKRVKAKYGFRCQVCGINLPTPSGSVAEGAHIHPLKDDGPDEEANILCLCPNHHALLDVGAWWVDDDHQIYDFTGRLAGELHVLGDHLVDPYLERHRRRWNH